MSIQMPDGRSDETRILALMQYAELAANDHVAYVRVPVADLLLLAHGLLNERSQNVQLSIQVTNLAGRLVERHVADWIQATLNDAGIE